LADLERPDAAVAVVRPALGQARPRGERAVGPDQVVATQAQHAEPGLVTDEHRIERTGGHQQADAEGAARSRRAPLRHVGPGHGIAFRGAPGEESGGRQGQSGDGRGPDELSSIQLAEPELVDQMVLVIGAPRPQRVDAFLG